MAVHRLVILLFLIFPVVSFSQEAQTSSSEIKYEMLGLKDPGYMPLEPLARGEVYKFPTENLHKRALWGWNVTLPDGRGFGFGGLAVWTVQEQDENLVRTDDPLIRTRVLKEGKWVFITEELRKKNPLQVYHEPLLNLVVELKHVYGLSRYIYAQGKKELKKNFLLKKKLIRL